MGQHYTDTKRASEPHALPDLEIFMDDAVECRGCGSVQPIGDRYGCIYCTTRFDDDANYRMEGRALWWYWPCLPGCLPDGDAVGPFETEAEALEDAREGMEE